MSGKREERIGEVRYLGLILNQFFNWSTHYTLLKKTKLSY